MLPCIYIGQGIVILETTLFMRGFIAEYWLRLYTWQTYNQT